MHYRGQVSLLSRRYCVLKESVRVVGISGSIVHIYMLYMGTVVIGGVVLMLLAGQFKGTYRESEAQVSNTYGATLPREVPIVEHDPDGEEVKRLNAAVAQIRSERTRLRKATKGPDGKLTGEQQRKSSELYALMTKMKARLRELEERRNARETHTFDE
jgi:hypothetical protein